MGSALSSLNPDTNSQEGLCQQASLLLIKPTTTSERTRTMTSTAGTVLLRAVPNRPAPDKMTVYETIATKLDVMLTGLRPTKTGLTAYTAKETDTDKFFTAKADKILTEIGLTPTLTAKKRAERSLICRQVVDFAGRRTETEIKDELQTKNKLDILNVTKFPNRDNSYKTHVIKIEFRLLEDAQTALTTGLKLFNTLISPRQIQQDLFIDIQMCFRCYKLDDHATKDCPRPTTYSICSHCGAEGHTHTQCPNPTNFTCLICKKQNDHRTMQMRCPTKKQIQKTKIEQAKSTPHPAYPSASFIPSNQTSYAAIAKSMPPPAIHTASSSSFNTSQPNHSLMALYLLHAHYENIINPGSFQTSFNNIQKHLGATTFLPVNPNPDSTKLIKTLTGQAPPTTTTSMTTATTASTTTTTTTGQPRQAQIQTDGTKRKTKIIKTSRDLVADTSDSDSSTTDNPSRQPIQRQRTNSVRQTVTVQMEPKTADLLLHKIQQDFPTYSTTMTKATAYIRQDAQFNPRKDLDIIQASKLYRLGQLKIQPQHDSKYTYHQLTKLLDNNQMNISKYDVNIVDATTFNKIRPDTARSPPQAPDANRQRTTST